MPTKTKLIAMLSVYVIISEAKSLKSTKIQKQTRRSIRKKMHRRDQNPPLKTTADPIPSGLVTDHKLQIITQSPVIMCSRNQY